MPTLDQAAASPLVKIMLIGHSGTGKTGALVSLVEAGYHLRILDLDMGLDALVNQVKSRCPDKLSTISFMSFRDKMKFGPTGSVLEGPPKAYAGALRALDKWEDGTIPAEWGNKYVLVIDSLTNLSLAAFRWARQMNPTAKEPRQWYSAAQELITDLIANVTSASFNSNVIIISHVEMTQLPDGQIQGFASAIGKALGPKLPRYFNTLVALEIQGQGTNVKRVLRTMPTALLTLKTPLIQVESELPIADGLAKLFAKLST